MKSVLAPLSGTLLCLFALDARAAGRRLSSPGGKVEVVVSDGHELHYHVKIDGQAISANSNG